MAKTYTAIQPCNGDPIQQIQIFCSGKWRSSLHSPTIYEYFKNLVCVLNGLIIERWRFKRKKKVVFCLFVFWFLTFSKFVLHFFVSGNFMLCRQKMEIRKLQYEVWGFFFHLPQLSFELLILICSAAFLT